MITFTQISEILCQGSSGRFLLITLWSYGWSASAKTYGKPKIVTAGWACSGPFRTTAAERIVVAGGVTLTRVDLREPGRPGNAWLVSMETTLAHRNSNPATHIGARPEHRRAHLSFAGIGSLPGRMHRTANCAGLRAKVNVSPAA